MGLVCGCVVASMPWACMMTSLPCWNVTEAVVELVVAGGPIVEVSLQLNSKSDLQRKPKPKPKLKLKLKLK